MRNYVKGYTAENFYTKDEIGNLSKFDDYALKTDVPTKTSQLTNDSSFISEHQDISGKQDVITDLEDIREGAALGKTSVQSLDGYAKSEDIPTKVSQLTNDSGYLTEHQSLDDYYTKAQIDAKNFLTEHQSLDDYYTKSAINGLIEGINSFGVLVVDSLPTENIDTHTIYLVAKTDSSTANDIYDEYIYINSAWEHIGTTSTNLDDYYTKTDIDGKGYLTLGSFSSKIGFDTTDSAGLRFARMDYGTVSGADQDAVINAYSLRKYVDGYTSAKLYTRSEVDSSFLKLSGGTMTGDLIIVNTTATSSTGVINFNGVARMGLADSNTVAIRLAGGKYFTVWNDSAQRRLLVGDSGVVVGHPSATNKVTFSISRSQNGGNNSTTSQYVNYDATNEMQTVWENDYKGNGTISSEMILGVHGLRIRYSDNRQTATSGDWLTVLDSSTAYTKAEIDAKGYLTDASLTADYPKRAEFETLSENMATLISTQNDRIDEVESESATLVANLKSQTDASFNDLYTTLDNINTLLEEI